MIHPLIEKLNNLSLVELKETIVLSAQSMTPGLSPEARFFGIVLLAMIDFKELNQPQSSNQLYLKVYEQINKLNNEKTSKRCNF